MENAEQEAEEEEDEEIESVEDEVEEEEVEGELFVLCVKLYFQNVYVCVERERSNINHLKRCRMGRRRSGSFKLHRIRGGRGCRRSRRRI
jgi:hypothetical protein